MNKSEQMVFEWYAPVVGSSLITPRSRTSEFKIMLPEYVFGRRGIIDTAPIARPFDNHFFGFALKVVIDCIAMVGGVLFAALATLLLWL
jgi:hypothetical protein